MVYSICYYFQQVTKWLHPIIFQQCLFDGSGASSHWYSKSCREKQETKEMIQRLKAHAALQEDVGSIPTHTG